MSEKAPARRVFMMKFAGATGALAVGVTSKAADEPAAAPAAGATAAPTEEAAGYQSFGPDEIAFVEAMVNVMCPADALTPSGVDCGLATYMDRQLAGAFGRGDRLYRQGPVRTGKPQYGYQLPLTPEQFFKEGVAAADAVSRQRFGKGFDELAPAQADAFLQEIGAGKVDGGRVPLGQWFNELVYPLFSQACFADPIYGGNQGRVFWKLIGYPGLPATHSQDIVTYRGKPFPGGANPKSIQDFS
jgi:gluconate 2-dehydrogenase gamma chain